MGKRGVRIKHNGGNMLENMAGDDGEEKEKGELT
jgi:hypothetical protein